MKVILLAFVLSLAFLTGACEKQSYSDTRAFTHHGQHGGTAADPHQPAAAGSATSGATAAEKPAGH